MRLLAIFMALIFGLLAGCSNIKMLTREDIYSKEFLKKIDSVQATYRGGDKASALAKLDAMEKSGLSKAEKGKVKNLRGIIFFSNSDYQKAAREFEQARGLIGLDKELKAQTALNLASARYKLEDNESAYNALEGASPENLSDRERTKFHQLRLLLAQSQKADKDVVGSLIYLLKDKKSFDAIEASEYKSLLMDSFRRLASSERAYILEKNDEGKGAVIPFLAAEEALQRYYFGDKSGAEDVLGWMDNNFGELADVKEFVDEFKYRINNFSKIDAGAIGVVLPLSGDKERFGQKALAGIDTALNAESSDMLSVKLYTRDSRNNPTVAKKLIHDLVQKHHVSMIIGGLFPSTAKEEYLEARKYGVVFVSLSPVHLDKEEKNHLLIEIPGSVQSQVAAIFSDQFLEKNGNEIAMLYPESEGGEAYVNEVWRKAKEGKIKIKSLASYDKNVKDYREWVERLLGLKFKREREEELELWKEVYSLEKKRSSIRRIQTLKPVVDFDWVFTPSYPHEAIQIIPAFTYFDARGLKYVGGPSWMSRRLMKEQRNLGSLRFVGDDPEDFDKSFVSEFNKRNGAKPGLVETLAYEAMNLGLLVVKGAKFEKREELERKLVNMQKLKGITGEWTLNEGIWLKDMDIMQIRSNEIKKAELTLNEGAKVEAI